MKNLSIIIPVYNEIAFIGSCLDSIFLQDFRDLSWEVLVSDGGSDDGTYQFLEEARSKFHNLKILRNEKKFQVYALNDMVSHAQGEVIIRCDAHASYSKDYFFNLYRKLIENPNIGNIGGRVETLPSTNSITALAISLGLSSKAGVGSSHRNTFSDKDIEVDTVLFGAWRSDIFKRVGLFDTEFIRGQDIEHNMRIKKLGLKIVQTPDVSLKYYARDEIKKLFKMMMQYASVKPYLFRKYGVIPTFRSIVPVFFYMLLILSFFISFKAFIIIFSLYFSFLITFSFIDSKRSGSSSFKLRCIMPFIYMTQHIGHAFGFLTGIVGSLKKKGIEWKSTR